MEFKSVRKRSELCCPLQMYKSPPQQSTTIKEFEELALQRLKLLQEVERIKQVQTQEGTDIQSKIYSKAKSLMPLSGVEEKSSLSDCQKSHEEKERDHISHFILRLAYCRTDEMRRWFVSCETELLKTRFVKLSLRDRVKFFEENKEDFDFTSVSLSDHLDKNLVKNLMEFKMHAGSSSHFYQVPFLVALDLVRSRQVVLYKGFAYIPENDFDKMASLVCNKFRARISEELDKTLHHLSVVDDDERILPLLKKLKYRYLGEDFSSVASQIKGQIQLAKINTISKESFPPCMRHLHETLRREHHLKHFARLQYGLFLKSIGLTLEQAITLWRNEFIKKIEPEKFDKQYVYGIRHSYGKEGKRASYSAYSCTKIIMSNPPGQGDCHGCPYRHWDEQHLQQMLVSHGLPHKGIQSIMAYTRDHHYQLACQKYFEITHDISAASFGLEHPSQFFLESRKLRGASTTEKT